MKLNTPTINIPIKNASPANNPTTAPAIASPKFSAVISKEKLNITARVSGSIKINANIVIELTSRSIPIIILNDLDNSII